MLTVRLLTIAAGGASRRQPPQPPAVRTASGAGSACQPMALCTYRSMARRATGVRSQGASFSCSNRASSCRAAPVEAACGHSQHGTGATAGCICTSRLVLLPPVLHPFRHVQLSKSAVLGC